MALGPAQQGTAALMARPLAPARPGMALLLTLLGILVLEIVATGVFHVATQQERTARAGVRTLRLQQEAQAAAIRALRDWDADSIAALALDGVLRFEPAQLRGPGSNAIATVQRVDAALYFLRVEVTSGLGERAGLGLALRTAAAADYLADLPAAVAVGGALEGTGSISGDAAEICSDGTTLTGLPALAFPDSLAMADHGGVLLDGSAVVTGAAAWSAAPAGVDLGALATVLAPGTYAPAPVLDAGTCTPVPENWGAPDLPEHPCADHFPVLRIPGDLVLDGGSGQGIVLVEGDALLASGARFDGLLLVRGTLTVSADVTLRGAARVGGNLRLDGGTIRFDPCAVARAVDQGRGTRGPFRAGAHWWLPF